MRMDVAGDLYVAHWHAARPDRVAGTRLDGPGPAQIAGVDPDGSGWAAVGGRLPPGASAANAQDRAGAWSRAATGHGAWAVFVDRAGDAPGLMPVRFSDARRRRVPARTPEQLRAGRALSPEQTSLFARLRPTAGTCRACGSVAWRMEPADPPAHGVRISCGSCGHDDGGTHAFFAAGPTVGH
jgi:hypothetical protein